MTKKNSPPETSCRALAALPWGQDAGADVACLLAAQRAAFEPIVEALRADHDRASGFDRMLAGRRYETAVATLASLDEALAATHPAGA